MDGCCAKHELIEKSIEQIQNEKIAIVQGMHELKERVNSGEERQKVANKRIDDLEGDNKVLNRLATAVEVLATEMKHMAERSDDHEIRLDSIEKKPAEYWQTLITILITSLVSGAFGFFVSLFVKGGA